jgi:putative endonuclease
VVTRSDLARNGEEVAARFLAARGWRIVARNVRCGRHGEIDIIAARGGILAFVEVKTRRTSTYGRPGEAVTANKQARIRSMAGQWLAQVRPRADVIRFDVIEVLAARDRAVVTHLEGVF